MESQHQTPTQYQTKDRIFLGRGRSHIAVQAQQARYAWASWNWVLAHGQRALAWLRGLREATRADAAATDQKKVGVEVHDAFHVVIGLHPFAQLAGVIANPCKEPAQIR